MHNNVVVLSPLMFSIKGLRFLPCVLSLHFSEFTIPWPIYKQILLLTIQRPLYLCSIGLDVQ